MKEKGRVIFRLKRNVGASNFKHAVGRDKLRPVLQGAGIDPVNQKLVCTDAVIMVMYPIEVFENKNNITEIISVPTFIFDRSHYYKYQSARGIFNMVDFIYVMDYDKQCIKVYPPLMGIDFIKEENHILKVDFIEGKFPNYKVVIPSQEKESIDTIGVDISRIENINKAIKEVGNKEQLNRFEFNFYGKQRAILGKEISLDHPIEFILMPVAL